MRDVNRFYIEGAWVAPCSTQTTAIIDPATDTPSGNLTLADTTDVDRAVSAAATAFPSFSGQSVESRRHLLQAVIASYQKHQERLAEAISLEMGAPLHRLARPAQVVAGLTHFQVAAAALADFRFETRLGATRVLREPVGVCVLITPWNWPANQIACKVAPALAAGCAMVLKPSELAPYSAEVMAEILHEAGVPKGVFNLIHGAGAEIGEPLVGHPRVDLISLTGSNRAGIAVAKAAADGVKRVALELGGKSANIVLADADFKKAITHGVLALMSNSGQSCNAPSRLLVPRDRLAEAEGLAIAALGKLVVGDPRAPETTMGPLANRAQWAKVQAMIERGISEGARLLAGGPGKPPGLSGLYARPTIFSEVTNTMDIARQEIFGPVLCLLPYDDEAQAIAIANDSPYGLSGYVYAGTLTRAREVARRLRTGNVHLNGAGPDFRAPFGGYKQSGHGREWGAFGIEEFLETKAIMGYGED